ncbi:MAG: hypothetical protein FDZ75_07200, partial [Actinobacteria bacterium]
MTAVAARYEAVRRQVADAADAAGRDPDDVRIVAVTKTVGIEEIRQALSAGVGGLGGDLALIHHRRVRRRGEG